MSEKRAPRGKILPATGFGLFLSLFGMILARQVILYFSPTLTFNAALWKEALIWLCTAVLLVVIRRGERLPLSAIGLGRSRLWKSILWGLAISLPCLLARWHPGHIDRIRPRSGVSCIRKASSLVYDADRATRRRC